MLCENLAVAGEIRGFEGGGRGFGIEGASQSSEEGCSLKGLCQNMVLRESEARTCILFRESRSTGLRLRALQVLLRGQSPSWRHIAHMCERASLS